MDSEEYRNILNNNKGELPEHGYLLFSVRTDNADNKLQLIKNTLLQISIFSENNWPEDQIWDRVLPEWFLKKMKSNTIEKLKANKMLWDYGSWLDAMKFRGWHWFSSKTEESCFRIVLEPYSFPFSVNPLEYLILETGVSLDDIHFEDHASL